ncbi:MAG: hypothetical protein K6E40_00660 [Desulfovibrio sp.]|nr:hypothetical protein [Desulfovibrio sp.]
MKSMLAFLIALGLAAPAFANPIPPCALVVDPDKAGTNVRDAPSGRIVDVIPYASAGSPDKSKMRRHVTLLSSEGKWLKVRYSGGEGYVHQSMLGICVESPDKGTPAALLAAPRSGSKPIGRIGYGTRARPLAFTIQNGSDTYLNIEILEGPLKGSKGWLNAWDAESNPYGGCWQR